jgi:hypothetical protein
MARRTLPIAAILLAGFPACVTLYQPMTGLHAPVVVDPHARNLDGVSLTVHCIPEDFLDRTSADALCRMVGVLFENQGASVRTVSSVRLVQEGLIEEPGEPTAPSDQPATDLTLELRSRKIHEAKNPLLWMLCVSTFTLVPSITEYTFTQDVIIRDETGFLLASQSLEGRLVQQIGIATWAGNMILDVAWRADADKLTGTAANEDLSRDLYRQLSQLVFNAKVQWQVLQEKSSTAANPVSEG